MTVGQVRRLRVMPVASSSDLDQVTNPFLLAHRLLKLDALPEIKEYTRKLRLSGIGEVCPREQLLGLRHDLKKRSNLGVNLRVTYDLGNGIHEFLQNAESYFGGSRLGWWRCSACRHKQFGRKPVQNCPECRALPMAFRHEEHSLHLPEDLPVSGHPDNFIEVAQSDIRIADFKSINGDEFDKLTAPLGEHILQVTGYMMYIAQDKTIPIRVNDNKGIVLYVSKKHTTKNLPFKAFHVEKNSAYTRVVESRVSEFRKGLQDDSFLPDPLTKCVTTQFAHWRSRQCQAVEFCRQHCT